MNFPDITYAVASSSLIYYDDSTPVVATSTLSLQLLDQDKGLAL